MWAALVFFFFFFGQPNRFLLHHLSLLLIFKNRINRHLQIVANIGTA